MKTLLTILLTSLSLFSFSQGEIERQVIGSMGNISSNGSIFIQSTVGETAVQTKTDGNLILTEGFQQPRWVEIIELNLKFYTGITPNNDQKNDYWHIDGILAYPTNSIVIFGRGGNLVWQGENYDNTSVFFEGNNISGNPLPTGTYFYNMDFENYPTKTGWIDITR